MDNKTNTQNGDAPDFVLRDGALRAAVWKSDGEYGPIFNTKVSRYYRNDNGDIRETTSLRERDLLPAAELTTEAHRTIRDRKRGHAQTHGPTLERRDGWHDEDASRKDISRNRFKKDRESGTRRRSKRDRSAR